MIESVITWRCDTPGCNKVASVFNHDISPGGEVEVSSIVDAGKWGSTYDTRTRLWKIYCPECVEKRKTV